MTIADLQAQVTAALKRGDAVMVETVRFLIAAIKTYAINTYGVEADTKLTPQDIESVIKKQVKTHRESVEAFEKASRTELAEKEKAQLAILEAYLPQQISDSELAAILAPIAKAGGEFGPMMGKAMAAVKGKADGSRVSAILRTLV